jgi:aminopeptidase
MSGDFESNLEKYAEIILKVGLNLQKGQRLLIGVPIFGLPGTPIELVPLVRLVVEKAYKAGARFVEVLWNDDFMRLSRFENAPDDSFDEFPKWRATAAYEAAKSGDAILTLFAENPELLKDQDPEAVGVYSKTNWTYIHSAMELITQNNTNWTVATAPVEGWAENIVPSFTEGDKKAQFWETIFEICRVKEESPLSAWDAHLSELAERAKYLNEMKFFHLKFSAPGTDLMVGLPKGHLWKSGRMTSQNGIEFTANIPTEEVFTLPHSRQVEGVVTSTRPLSYGGKLIEDFTLEFSQGMVTEANASKNEETLLHLLNTDEGARRLGEVALVPNSSPISQSGKLFKNILLDENASSHIALGTAYKFSIEDGNQLSDESFVNLGGNQSLIHVDFMIGSGEMHIDGIREDGAVKPVMRDGEWVIRS